MAAPTVSDLVEWAMTRWQKPRKPPVMDLPDMPPHVKQFLEADDSAQTMQAAWEMHDQTMLLSDNDAKLADQAFAAVRASRRKKKR